MTELSDQMRADIEDLRSQGFAVVIYTPDEIGDADAGHLEDVLVERGSIFLSR